MKMRCLMYESANKVEYIAENVRKNQFEKNASKDNIALKYVHVKFFKKNKTLQVNRVKI